MCIDEVVLSAQRLASVPITRRMQSMMEPPLQYIFTGKQNEKESTTQQTKPAHGKNKRLQKDGA